MIYDDIKHVTFKLLWATRRSRYYYNNNITTKDGNWTEYMYITTKLYLWGRKRMKVYYTEMATIGDSHKVVDPRKKWEKNTWYQLYTVEWWWESKRKPIGKAPSDIKKKMVRVKDSACVREKKGGSKTVCLWGY